MKTSIFVLTLFLFIACEHNGHRDHNHDHHQSPSFPEMTLVDGKKWEANPETTEGIRNMHAALKDFSAGGGRIEDLAGRLEQEYQYIIQKCTMKGDGHQQLHHFLVPVQHYIQQIKTGDRQAEESVAPLKEHIESYGNYFE